MFTTHNVTVWFFDFVSNDTRVFSGSTDSNGHFSFTRDLQPRNPQGQPTFESATYTIEADFAGDTLVSATAYSNMLDGTSYAACTTVQFSYKSSSNSTMLTVEPQATQLMTQTKTLEQMQKEAQNSGLLSIWHEFSWWYPWYRLHVKININPRIRVGWITVSSLGNTEYFI